MELSIRKLGNSVGIIIPPALLRAMRLSVGSAVTAENVEGKLVLTPATKQHYKLSYLVAQCNLKAQPPKDLAGWNSMQPVGREAL